MTLILKNLFNFFKLLNSDTGENQIAFGVACGMVLGFAPFLSLQTLFVFALIFFLRIQLGAALTSAFFFGMISFILDPLFNMVGIWFLELNALKPLYTTMYNMPILPFTKFYNSIAMGALVVSIVLLVPVAFLFRALTLKYRKTVVERFKTTKMFKAFKATSFYKWYAKYDQLYG